MSVGTCQGQNTWGLCIGSLCLCWAPCSYCKTGIQRKYPWLTLKKVREVEDGVVFVWGEYQGTLSKAGVYCLVSCVLVFPDNAEPHRSRSKNHFSTETISVSCTNEDCWQNVRDSTRPCSLARGNPLLVSGIVVFYFSDSKKIAIEIRDPLAYVANAAQAVLKKVCRVLCHPDFVGCW